MDKYAVVKVNEKGIPDVYFVGNFDECLAWLKDNIGAISMSETEKLGYHIRSVLHAV